MTRLLALPLVLLAFHASIRPLRAPLQGRAERPFLAPGLPDTALAAARPHRQSLGFRRPRACRSACRQRGRRWSARTRVPARDNADVQEAVMRGWVETARVARLATIDADGRPHLVPVVFVLDGQRLYSAVDAKPKRSRRLRRLLNARERPDVTVLVDHYEDDWGRLWSRSRPSRLFSP
jgi:hypothetical protein